LESYTAAAGKVARMAVGFWKTPTVSTYVLPSDTTQDYHAEGMTLGTRGGIVVRQVFPADGEYKLSIKSLRNGPFVADEQVEVVIDGDRVHLFDYNDYKTANSIFAEALAFSIPIKAARTQSAQRSSPQITGPALILISTTREARCRMSGLPVSPAIRSSVT
jgi:hypothetical protein